MQVIRDLLTPKTYVIVVEHDLAVLDYLSDFICCLYGKPGAASHELAFWLSVRRLWHQASCVCSVLALQLLGCSEPQGAFPGPSMEPRMSIRAAWPSRTPLTGG